MNNQLENELFKKYPTLFREREKTLMHSGIACGDGWYKLIDLLSEFIVSCSKDIRASQIKEKFGALRFYISYVDKKNYLIVSGLTTMAETLSAVICDKCGLAGQRNNGPYICTRCKKHSLNTDKTKEQSFDLPFDTGNIGSMWLAMITSFYLHVDANRHMYTNLIFISASKEDGHLVLSMSGGDEHTDAMLTMLLAYANKVDEETGQVKR